MYISICGISVLIMICSVWWNRCTNSSVSDVIKNLAFGCVAFKDIDYHQEKHTWVEWYEITKNRFEECDRVCE